MAKRRKMLAIIISISIFTLIAFTLNNLNTGFEFKNSTSKSRAAIVDHLSTSQPNKALICNLTTILENAGFEVDYYRWEDITVDFYRNLPKNNYKIIIFRVHSALGPKGEAPVVLFTSEPYTWFKYPVDQLLDRLKKVHFSYSDSFYFGITPFFIKNMRGKFNNTVIILMGCSSLTYTDTAEAFVEKGASIYIGWSHVVLPTHADKATLLLLKHLLVEKKTIKSALNETFNEVGYDPHYLSKLLSYPPDKSSYTVFELLNTSESFEKLPSLTPSN